MVRDFELLLMWRDGDKDAGNELFGRHFATMRRFFRSKVDPADAEDLIGRTLLECVKSVDGFRCDASFRTYLFTIARRELGHFVRVRLREAGRQVVDLTVSSIADLGLSPSKFTAHMQAHQRVIEAMRHLPVDFQITLELHYWEQLTGPELAQVLDIAPTTVRTRLHRAREALRVRLEALGTHAGSDAGVEQSIADVQHLD